jgi:hypothetical protein
VPCYQTGALTQLGHIGQPLDCGLAGLLELFGGQTLRAGIVACRLVGGLRAVGLLPRLGGVGEVAGLLLQARARSRRRVLLVGLARGAAGGQCRHVGRKGVCLVSAALLPRLVGRRGRAGLGLGGRAHGRQQPHRILEDVGQVEGARRLVGFAGAALGRLLRAGEGLLRGRAGAAHIAAARDERRRRSGELEAVSAAVGGHGARSASPCKHAAGWGKVLRRAVAAAAIGGRSSAGQKPRREDVQLGAVKDGSLVLVKLPAISTC